MLDPGTLLFCAAVIFVAGATQSLTGFGFGLIAIPLLTLVISPKLAPPIVLIDGIVLNLYILKNAYVAVQPRRISGLTIAGLAGVPIGTYILAHFEVAPLRIYIGIMTCIVAVLFLSGFRRQLKNEQAASVPIGFVSGIMSGSINMAGPPVILFFANQGLPRSVFRANIVAYFFTLQLIAIPLMLYHHIMTHEALIAGLLLLPGLVVGGLVGGRFANRVNDQLIRNLTLVIVSLAGVLSILNGFDLI